MQKLKKNDFVRLPGNYDGGDYARVVEIVNGFATLEWWWDGALRTSSVEVGADIYERVNDDVNGWLRRTHRKGPYKLPPDWEKKRIDVMYWALVHKFSSKNPWLQQQLIDTGSQQIFEGNSWGDTFWGVDIDTLQGRNMLGCMLMDIRETLQ